MALTATVTFRTSPEYKERIDNLARETRRSASFYYNLLLEERLDDLEDIYLAEKTYAEIKAGKQRTYSLEEVSTELDDDD